MNRNVPGNSRSKNRPYGIIEDIFQILTEEFLQRSGDRHICTKSREHSGTLGTKK